jgi:F-type H+-transporting ATPase subunit gamma
MQITSAMKLVAASKLKRAQDNIVQMRPYANKLYEILENISQSQDGSEDDSNLMVDKEPTKVLLILISSNRGLCGSFNTTVIRQATKLIEEKYAAQYKAGNLSLMTIGKKVFEYFERRDFTIVANHSSLWDNLNFAAVNAISGQLISEFEEGKYDRIEIVYNQFKNAASQIIQSEQFLPIVKDESKSGEQEANLNTDYIFEPNTAEILEQLRPKILKVQFYKAILDSNASEHGARMTAMHQATENAGEMLDALKLEYNKARQASITKELLEIVAGAEALNS